MQLTFPKTTWNQYLQICNLHLGRSLWNLEGHEQSNITFRGYNLSRCKLRFLKVPFCQMVFIFSTDSGILHWVVSNGTCKLVVLRSCFPWQNACVWNLPQGTLLFFCAWEREKMGFWMVLGDGIVSFLWFPISLHVLQQWCSGFGWWAMENV